MRSCHAHGDATWLHQLRTTSCQSEFPAGSAKVSWGRKNIPCALRTYCPRLRLLGRALVPSNYYGTTTRTHTHGGVIKHSPKRLPQEFGKKRGARDQGHGVWTPTFAVFLLFMDFLRPRSSANHQAETLRSIPWRKHSGDVEDDFNNT